MSDRILVVDDDASIRETLRDHLLAHHEVEVARDAEDALRIVATWEPDLVITDVRMPGASGIELLGVLRERRSTIDVIVITAHEDMATAIRAMKSGAYDYLVKPLDLDQVDLVIGRCLRDRRARARADRLTRVAAEPYALDHLVGRDPAMIAVFKRVGQVADAPTPVLIVGETGTGKELIAKALHYNSTRAGEPFVAINCAAMPENLLEAELFGHTRGAFTGALTERRGRFDSAGRGTLLLDEIGDTTPAFQAKLLRVLDAREFFPVGSDRARRMEARVVAATHRDLPALVREGTFREDLYYRLRVVELRLPALRQRVGDIEALAQCFAERLASEMGLARASFSAPAMERLRAWRWPGNVRELQNTVHRALLSASGGVIGAEHLEMDEVPVSDAAPGDVDDETIDGAVRAQVERVLRKVAGNKRQAARRLGISRPTLDRLIERHGLEAMVSRRDTDGNGT